MIFPFRDLHFPIQFRSKIHVFFRPLPGPIFCAFNPAKGATKSAHSICWAILGATLDFDGGPTNRKINPVDAKNLKKSDFYRFSDFIDFPWISGGSPGHHFSRFSIDFGILLVRFWYRNLCQLSSSSDSLYEYVGMIFRFARVLACLFAFKTQLKH